MTLESMTGNELFDKYGDREYAETPEGVYPAVMRRLRPLSLEEEQKYGRMLKGTEKEREEAITAFVERNLRLVYDMAYKVGGKLYASQKDDIIQESVLGLLKAAQRYDIDKGFRFTTYATHWIFQSITRYLASNRTQVRMPAHLDQAWLKMMKLRKEADAEHKTISDEKMTRMLGLSKEQYNLIKDHSDTELSLNRKVNSEEDAAEMGELIASDEKTPEEDMIDSEKKVLVEKLMCVYLTEREQDILEKRFGFNNRKIMTFETIANE